MSRNFQTGPVKGFALQAAIFVLVVVAAMVVAMVRLAGSQSVGESLNLLSVRAYWAAQSGSEWGAYEAYNSAPGTCFSAHSLALNGFTVAISCTVTGYAEASVANNVFRYEILSNASTAGASVDDPDYVYRAVSTSIVIRN